jgi:hypothetical protein
MLGSGLYRNCVGARARQPLQSIRDRLRASPEDIFNLLIQFLDCFRISRTYSRPLTRKKVPQARPEQVAAVRRWLCATFDLQMNLGQ